MQMYKIRDVILLVTSQVDHRFIVFVTFPHSGFNVLSPGLQATWMRDTGEVDLRETNHYENHGWNKQDGVLTTKNISLIRLIQPSPKELATHLGYSYS